MNKYINLQREEDDCKSGGGFLEAISNNNPPSEQDDTWKEMITLYTYLVIKNFKSEEPLMEHEYKKWLFEEMKKHYTLIKK